MTTPGRRPLPPSGGTPREVARAIHNLFDGKVNSVSTVTLNTGTGSTTVSDIRVTPSSYIGLAPSTAEAASAMGTGTVFVSTRSDQQFKISHNGSGTGSVRTFVYVVLG